MKTLLLASLLVIPTLKNVSVSTEVVIKDTTTSLNDLQVIATDLATGEEINRHAVIFSLSVSRSNINSGRPSFLS